MDTPISKSPARILEAGAGAPVTRVCVPIRSYGRALRAGDKEAPRSYGLLLEHVRRFFIGHPHGAPASRRVKRGKQPQAVRSADGIKYV